jgi:hypothetical protein
VLLIIRTMIKAVQDGVQLRLQLLREDGARCAHSMPSHSAARCPGGRSSCGCREGVTRFSETAWWAAPSHSLSESM